MSIKNASYGFFNKEAQRLLEENRKDKIALD